MTIDSVCMTFGKYKINALIPIIPTISFLVEDILLVVTQFYLKTTDSL